MVSTVRTYFRMFLRVLWTCIQLVCHTFFSVVIYRNPGERMPPVDDPLLLESATAIATKIRTKKITSETVLEVYIRRIRQVNPLLNCIVAERFGEARKEAKSVDARIASETFNAQTAAKETPFLGVPFTTKDCIGVKGMIQTAGLLSRRHCVAPEDSDVVVRLKAAGAIPIALTNVSEMCMWWESANKVHGRTRNPYDTNRIVGGSSGGEGAGQAACVSAFGVGSDIGGSIRMPAFFNGIFGHKPSPGIVSNRGQYPAPLSADQNLFLGIGPMCRHADDLLPLLRVLVGPQRALSIRLGDDDETDEVNVRNLRFFYQDSDGGGLFISPVHTEIKALFKRAALYLQTTYDVKMQRTELKSFRKSLALWLSNMRATNAPTFAEQLTDLNGAISPVWELLKWPLNLSNYTLMGILTAITDSSGIDPHGSVNHQRMVQQRNRLRAELVDMLGDDGVFLYPTHPTPAPYHVEPITKPFNFAYTSIVNVLMLPATHIPMGLCNRGLPIGLQVVANEGQDRLCLAVAREFERAFGGWTPPIIADN